MIINKFTQQELDEIFDEHFGWMNSNMIGVDMDSVRESFDGSLDWLGVEIDRRKQNE